MLMLGLVTKGLTDFVPVFPFITMLTSVLQYIIKHTEKHWNK